MRPDFASSEAETVSGRVKRVLGRLKDCLATAFLFWLTWVCASGLWDSIELGYFKGRYSRGLYLSDNPIAFWFWSGFFGLGTILVGGMAVFCLWVACVNLTRK